MQTVGHKPLDNISVYKKTVYIKLCLEFLYHLQNKTRPSGFAVPKTSEINHTYLFPADLVIFCDSKSSRPVIKKTKKLLIKQIMV